MIVDKGEGRFDPRAGPARPQQVPVTWKSANGIKDGELVVTAANFLIDAESNLKSALKILTGAGAPQ